MSYRFREALSGREEHRRRFHQRRLMRDIPYNIESVRRLHWKTTASADILDSVPLATTQTKNPDVFRQIPAHTVRHRRTTEDPSACR